MKTPFSRAKPGTRLDGEHPNAGNGGTGSQRQGHHGARLLSSVPLPIKNHIVAAVSEFIGTFLFLFFAFGGTQAVNTAPLAGQPTNLAANPARLLFIALSFGISLAVNAWVFYRISGGLFNPVVSLAMVLAGAMGVVRALLVVLAQILGGIAAAAVVAGLLPGHLSVGTTLGGGTSVVQGLFLEMFLTAQLVFTIFMLAGEKHRGTFMAPIGIGLSLFITQLMGVYYTGASLNPARSFGPAVVSGVFPDHHWIYWIGPILGSLLASFIYYLAKAVDYTTVNPSQDAAEDSLIPSHGDLASNAINSGDTDHGANSASHRNGAFETGPMLERGDGSRISQH